MNLKELDKPLGREHIDFRIGTFKDGRGFSVLAYKDARVDMAVLDEVVGKNNWQVKYHRDPAGTLACRIGIYDETKKQWIWKESNGSESNQDAEKGQYSDAFKRAGFMWGIGRALYDMPFIWCRLEQGEDKYVKPNDWTWVVEHDGRSYTHLKATDRAGKIRYEYKAWSAPQKPVDAPKTASTKHSKTTSALQPVNADDEKKKERFIGCMMALEEKHPGTINAVLEPLCLGSLEEIPAKDRMEIYQGAIKMCETKS